MSLFDSLGPIMTGPSSSHTAGVLRIGRMGRQFIGGDPDAIELRFYGALAHTYKGHVSDSAIIGGLIGLKEDSPDISKAYELAAAKGISVTIVPDPSSDKNPNTVDMRLTKGGKVLKVVGISVGGGEIRMTEFDDFPLCLYGNEDVLVVETAKDISLANVLGDQLLNIRCDAVGGKKLYVGALHTPVTGEQVQRIKALPGVLRVFPLSTIYSYKLVDSDPLFASIEELLALCKERAATIPEMAIAFEQKRSGLSREGVLRLASSIWNTMAAAVDESIKGNNRLIAGFMPGNDGAKVMRLVQEGGNVSGRTMGTAIARAIAVMEYNGCMGCVAAAPTAGACGVMPGALLTVAENLKSGADEVHRALLAGAMMGVLITMRAPVSGALGGCQSEIGVASAMTAASLVQLAGGKPEDVAHGMALALKSVLGLICDPVAGPVEIPCIKRNAIGVGNAMAAADMALAGVRSVIPPDEVIDALINTQQLLPRELRGTLSGGLASTKTAHRLKDEWRKKIAEAAITGP
ncbi:MAG: L-serine ammonia-lyase, iron-sulfur-dependent, subunit alpha [Candidatus Accumulibacter sp.]|jgi:L-serine dehydratase|nr:L-serine ammonia-lyase, iron-sulfur-dependent, subunit alpha [Accumulibacter sp.]